MTELRRPRNPFDPIRIPADPGSDALLEWLAKIYGTTVEEARERGRQASKMLFTLKNLTPRPMKAPVGAIFFICSDGTVDKEGLKAAKMKNEVAYIRRCEEMGIKP